MNYVQPEQGGCPRHSRGRSANPLDKGAEFATARTNRAHIVTASYDDELPFARGSAAAWRKGLIAGWQVAGITRMESGPAARIQVVDCNYEGSCFPEPLRPNQVADPAAGSQTGPRWFNPAAFLPPPAGEYGAAPVLSFRLPGGQQRDSAAS